jgi:hypothetical protein
MRNTKGYGILETLYPGAFNAVFVLTQKQIRIIGELP